MVLNRIHAHLKTIGRGSLALMGLVWLSAAAAPCVSAQANMSPAPEQHCPKPAKYNKHLAAVMDCSLPAAVTCQAPDADIPLTSGFGDFAATLVLLTMTPIDIIQKIPSHRPQHDFLTPDYPAPPLHIRHLALLR